MTHLIAVYGTLKAGYHNSDMLKKAKYLGQSEIKGALQIIGLGCPLIFENIDNPHTEDKHTVEIYKTSKETYQEIENMELNAGYYIKEIDTKYGPARTFYTSQLYFNPKKAIIKEYTWNSLKEYYNQIKNENKRNKKDNIIRKT